MGVPGSGLAENRDVAGREDTPVGGDKFGDDDDGDGDGR